jgi:hypothetical protein
MINAIKENFSHSSAHASHTSAHLHMRRKFLNGLKEESPKKAGKPAYMTSQIHEKS